MLDDSGCFCKGEKSQSIYVKLRRSITTARAQHCPSLPNPRQAFVAAYGQVIVGAQREEAGGAVRRNLPAMRWRKAASGSALSYDGVLLRLIPGLICRAGTLA